MAGMTIQFLACLAALLAVGRSPADTLAFYYLLFASCYAVKVFRAVVLADVLLAARFPLHSVPDACKYLTYTYQIIRAIVFISERLPFVG